MDPGVDKFFATPESFIAQSKNEDLGAADTTTLLPLDANTLEVICRVNLPGVQFTGTDVDNFDNEYGFNQILRLHTRREQFGSLYVNIVQCPSHAQALEAMRDILTDEIEEDWDAGLRCEGLGNYAVEFHDASMHSDYSVNVTWVRWTTVVEISSETSKGGIRS